MKKRGENLDKHYPQAFEYWLRLVPNRPQYVILCNFDEFWIYDFNSQLDDPVDIVSLTDLPQRQSAFNFMAKAGNTKPIFQNNQVEVTEKAGQRMGDLVKLLQQRLNPSQSSLEKKAGGDKTLQIQRFTLQCVLAMFAEDRGLLPHDMFISCVQECLDGGNSYDVLGGLFREMNTQGITPGERKNGW